MLQENKKSKYLEGLNPEQKEAVLHGKGPLLIVAGAGTGKTTVITRRIANLIENKLAEAPEILAVTFTDKAAGEMEERVDRLLPFGYLDLWISTFHSFCERVLKEHGLDIGLPTNFKLLDQTGSWVLIRQNLAKFNLNYYRPLGNPSKFIHALIDHFARCKDEAIFPEDYLQYADDIKRNFDDGIFGSKTVDKKEKITQKEKEIEQQRISELADAYHTYQRLLLENNALDFGDLINYCLKLFKERPAILDKYRNQFKYILVDEFQDTNWAQYELIKTLAAPGNNLMVNADDDQCLPGDSKIQMFQKGEVKERSIKNVRKGEMALTAVGKGHIGVSKVNKVFKKKKKTRILILTTKSGYKLKVTDNHKMFCFVPKTSRQGIHYVYLMYRQGLEWRMGVTDDLILRLNLERSADFIIGIKAFSTDREARYYETLWSLKYGIPTSCFQKRRGVIIEGEFLKKLYQDLDIQNGVARLAKDFHIDLNSPHHCLNAVYRGHKRRIIININMCARRSRSKEHVKKGKLLLLNPSINHRVSLETSDTEILRKIRNAGFSLRNAKKGQMFKMESADLQKVWQIAEKLEKLTGGIIKIKFSLASKYNKIASHRRTRSAIVMPAKNLLPGHYLPIRRGPEVIYDRIVKIKEEEWNEAVYDLEIDRTHNFIANGIVVHNSVFRFQGASLNNVLQFKKDFPESKEIILVENYRSTQNILDLTYNFIQLNNPNRLEYQLNQDKEIAVEAKEKGIELSSFKRIDKKLRAKDNSAGLIEHLHFATLEREAEGVARKIAEIMNKDREANFSDFSVLVRANDSATAFFKELERQRIPYEFLASKGLYSQPVILDLISYFRLLDNYHESPALNRLLSLSLFAVGTEELVKINQFSKKKTQSTYETLQELSLLPGISKNTVQKVGFLIDLIKKHSKLVREKSIGDVFLAFLNDSGYLKEMVKQENERDLNLITQFYKKIKSFEENNPEPTLVNFMQAMNMELESGETGSLETDIEKGPDAVKIMTIHSAKGLEFKYVFITNLVDKRFPTIERKEAIEIPEKLVKEIVPSGDVHLQEERRLFYVAMTRAKKGLFFTSADDYGGTREKKLSRFLREINFEKPGAPSGDKISLEPKGVESGEERKAKYHIPPYFSYSQFAAFEKCPQQYKFAHILKIPRIGTAIFSFGKTIHKTLRQFLEDYLESQEESQKGLFGSPAEENAGKEEIDFSEQFKKMTALYEGNWIDEWYEDKKQKQEYFKLGKEILKDFLEKFFKEQPKIKFLNKRPSLELDFSLKIGDNTIKGKIDRVDELPDGQLEIIDYKTGKGKGKLAKDEKEQLLIYQLAGEQIFGKTPECLSYYYLEIGGKTSFQSSEPEREKFKQEVLNKIEKIKNSDFRATPGWQCQSCDFKNICEFRKIH
ncbi:UvrD-helicase domain-containing protein [Patescibacteria group bacterium]|nr:UvrD-helicase domain-containing protein [Patescibacteria group bacterium]